MTEPATTDDGSGNDSTASTSSSRPELNAPEDRGSLKLADRVIEKVASMAAREVDAVVAHASGWRKLAGRPLPRATATIAGGRSRIGVDIAAAWPTPLAEVAHRTRDHVHERVTALTGMDVVAVDVTVSHIANAHPQRQRVL